ncbi:hypothetical protein [Pleomorphochaeta sp. DL1XJH-081]|uniref:hypothetical protein n=1 Tax=Pleomorphochaeta sp. DL1XJH-081 TaxID=3409690 RepID=UPI003BB6D06F
MKVKKLALFLILLFTLNSMQLFAAADPNWYETTFFVSTSMEDYSQDIKDYNTDMYVGYVAIAPVSAWTNPWDGDLTLVISSPSGNPINPLRIYKENDPTVSFPASIKVEAPKKKDDVVGTQLPFTFPYTLPENYTQFTLRLTVDTQIFMEEMAYSGNYSLPFRVTAYIDYDTTDEVEIGSFDYVVRVKYTDRVPTYVTTQININAFPAASSIDIPALQTSGASVPVGSVEVIINDPSEQNDYFVRIGPVEAMGNPLAQFLFKKVNGTVEIPYKVRATHPDSILPEPTFFDLEVRNFSGGVHSDTFDLEISDMNYDDVTYTVGDYTSEIQVDIIRN